MEYINFKGLKLSKIALGTAEFGAKVSKEDAFAIIDKYIEQGGNILDTARVYASWRKNGANASERTVGEYIKEKNCRNKVIIVTKGGHPRFESMTVSRMSKEEIKSDLEESLHYLNVDYIDIYFLHRDDIKIPVSEIMKILDVYVKKGKIKYLGASNWTAKRIKEANEYAVKNNLTPFSFSQIMWNYTEVNKNSTFLDKTLAIMDDKEYEEYNTLNDVQLMAYSSQSQGFYSKYAKLGEEQLSEQFKSIYVNQNNIIRANKLMKLAKENGISETAIALNHIINNKLTGIAVIGPHNVKLLLDSLESFKFKKELLDQVDINKA